MYVPKDEKPVSICFRNCVCFTKKTLFYSIKKLVHSEQEKAHDELVKNSNMNKINNLHYFAMYV